MVDHDDMDISCDRPGDERGLLAAAAIDAWSGVIAAAVSSEADEFVRRPTRIRAAEAVEMCDLAVGNDGQVCPGLDRQGLVSRVDDSAGQADSTGPIQRQGPVVDDRVSDRRPVGAPHRIPGARGEAVAMSQHDRFQNDRNRGAVGLATVTGGYRGGTRPYSPDESACVHSEDIRIAR